MVAKGRLPGGIATGSQRKGIASTTERLASA